MADEFAQQSVLWSELSIDDVLPEPAVRCAAISVVIPFFGQGLFLEATIDSVVSQNYQAMDIVVVDCGSDTDHSALRERFSGKISLWERREGKGYYFAVNEALKLTKGEIMTWLPVGVRLAPGSLRVINHAFDISAEILFVAGLPPFPAKEAATAQNPAAVPELPQWTRSSYLNLENIATCGYTISELLPFWRRELWLKNGGSFDMTFKVAQDFELWARFLRSTQLHIVEMALTAPHGDRVGPPEPPSGTYLTECTKVIGREHSITSADPALDTTAPPLIKQPRR